MRALEGSGVPRDSKEAARHLWQSVRNKNGAALLALAGLYAKGDGVAQDCDQARVLMDAATKQAKSHAQFQRAEIARQELRNAGCQ
jgi:TPR repeat protein